MPSWSNNDKSASKPKWVVDRQTRETVQLNISLYPSPWWGTSGGANNTGNNVLTLAYTDGAQNNVANIGVAVGQYVYFMANGFTAPGGTAGNGYPGFFQSNTTVSAISGNTITITPALFNNVANSFGIEFDKVINYGATAGANTYNQDTILITASRTANGNTAVANSGNFTAGWVHIQKKVNSDGTIRYLKETLVALANATAANVSSGNTSFGSVVNGI